MKRLLITGASGFIGASLLEALKDRYEAHGAAFTRAREGLDAVDLADEDAARALFEARRPELVIHCAAMADPDKCEKDPEAARRANVQAARAVAELSAEHGARLIHVSTDLVFDGARGLYTERDEPAPLSAYGRSKLAGEHAALEACPSAAVVRVSLVYGRARSGRPSFLDWLIGELSAGRRAKVFTDQWRTPTAMAQLPEVFARLAASDARGVFHWGGAQRVTRLEFAQAACRVFGLSPALLEPIRMADFGYSAARPRDCSLVSDALARRLDLAPWGLEGGLNAER